jgi:outer membrane protein TolC
MRHLLQSTRSRLALSVVALAVLSGCASVSLEQNVRRVNDEAGTFTEGRLSLARTDAERAQRVQAAENLLNTPLGQREAVHLTLVNSPALQALLAQGWAESAEAAQTGRISNPMVSFERMVSGSNLELGRALSFGLLDLLTLPSRQGMANHRIAQSQLRLSSEVVDQVTQVRQAWVRAVAAQQTFTYAQQVYASAEAGADLARRLQSVGTFNRLSRAREQAFYADAATRLATAGHQVTASREELVRLLGLDDAQARQLKLPARLPDLPKQALDPDTVAAQATRGRLDIRLAQAELEASAKAQGISTFTSFTDIELTARRNTQFDNAAGTRADARGVEIGIRLPVFDWGGLQRDAMNARTLAAANQLEATVRAAGSSLRESYSAYRTAHDIARHHRDEVVPLRKIISEENLLRYNGMLIGVFELLADSRDQVSAVVAAIDTEQQFWLADAALQATLIGRPTNTTLSTISSAPSGGGAGH